MERLVKYNEKKKRPNYSFIHPFKEREKCESEGERGRKEEGDEWLLLS